MSRGRLLLLPVLLLAPACFDLSRPEPASDAQPDVARLDTARPESGRPDLSVDFRPDASAADTSAPDTTRADAALPADSSLPPKDTAPAVDACVAPQPEVKGSVFATPGLLLCRVSASGDTVSFYEASADKSCNDLAGSLTLTGATISGSAGPQFIAIALCSVAASGNALSFSLLGAECVDAGSLTLAGATASGGAAGDVLCGCSGSGQVLTFFIRDDFGDCNKKAGTITLAGTTTCP